MKFVNKINKRERQINYIKITQQNRLCCIYELYKNIFLQTENLHMENTF